MTILFNLNSLIEEILSIVNYFSSLLLQSCVLPILQGKPPPPFLLSHRSKPGMLALCSTHMHVHSHARTHTHTHNPSHHTTDAHHVGALFSLGESTQYQLAMSSPSFLKAHILHI
jgi:hypothetical protein